MRPSEADEKSWDEVLDRCDILAGGGRYGDLLSDLLMKLRSDLHAETAEALERMCEASVAAPKVQCKECSAVQDAVRQRILRDEDIYSDLEDNDE